MAEKGAPLDAETLREWTLVRGETGSASDSGRGTLSDRGSKSGLSKPSAPITLNGTLSVAKKLESLQIYS